MTDWEPDLLLVPAVLVRSRSYTDLTPPDRCWVIAGLTVHGLTTDDIAERLHCSKRLIHTLRAEPLYTVSLWAQREMSAFEDELRLARSEHRHALLSQEAAELETKRLSGQLSRMFGATAARTCSRNHDLTSPYARYERGGRTWCRECHRERQATYRAKRRIERTTTCLTP